MWNVEVFEQEQQALPSPPATTAVEQHPLSFEDGYIGNAPGQLIVSSGVEMEASQLDLLRTDEMDIALRLSYLQHCGGPPSGSLGDDKEARRKEKKKQKDLKVPYLLVCWCLTCAFHCAVILRGLPGNNVEELGVCSVCSV